MRPQIAIFESVTAAYSRGDTLMRALRKRLEELTGDAYELHHVLHNANALGGPCTRRRYFWVASRVPFGVEHPQLPYVATFGNAILDLTYQPLSWDAQPYELNGRERFDARWAATRHSPTNTVDGHMYLDKPIDRRLCQVLETTRWEQGECLEDALRRSIAETGSVPSLWENAPFLQNENDDWKFGWSTERRWFVDRPGHVITGAGQYSTMHPYNPRPITQREVARLMGFPDDWLIEPLRKLSNLNNTWGKGITVDCGRWISTWARRSLLGEPGELRGAAVGDREWEIHVKKPWLEGQPAPDELIYLTHQTVGRRRSQSRREPEMPVRVPAMRKQEVHDVSETETAEKRRYVRRDKEVVEANRERVWDLLSASPEGLKRHQIAEKLGLTESEVYEAIWFYLKLAEGAPRVQRDKRLWRTTDHAVAV